MGPSRFCSIPRSTFSPQKEAILSCRQSSVDGPSQSMAVLYLPVRRAAGVMFAPEKCAISERSIERSRLGAGGEQSSRLLVWRSMAGGGGTAKRKATNASGQTLGRQGAASQKTGERARGGGGRDGSSEQAWPALKKRHLPLHSRRELRGLDLFSVPGFLSPKECEGFIQAAEALGFKQQGSLGPKFGEAFRHNGRVSLQSPFLADKLWEAGLSSLFEGVTIDGSRAVGLNPNIRFYRYSVGQQFGQHIDESAEVGEGKTTQFTLLIYLTGGENADLEYTNRRQLVGGETVFYDGRRVVAEVPPLAGMALLHVHGDQCLLHEARVVAKGVKYVLRSDVVFD